MSDDYNEFGKSSEPGNSSAEYHYQASDLTSDDYKKTPQEDAAGSEQSYAQGQPEDPGSSGYSAGQYQQSNTQSGYSGSGYEPPRQQSYSQNYSQQGYQQQSYSQRPQGTYPPPPKPPKKSNGKALKVVGLIAIIVVALVVGGLVMTAILQPSIGAQSPATTQQALPSSTAEQPAESSDQPTESSSTPSEAPKLGGETPAITDYSNPVPDIAESVSPSVVGVTAYIEQSTQQQDQYYGWGQQQQQQQQDSQQAQQQTERVAYSRGSGFVISEDGYVLTNSHVISSGTYFEVTMADGKVYEAKLLGNDATLDVAVLKIEATGLKAVAILGDDEAVKAGEQCIAIGNPSGVGENLVNSVTVGYVSAVDREVMFNGATQKFIQTDAAINPGNSGGPLLSSTGKVIGIVTLKSLVSSYDANGNAVDTEGIGFAIPIKTAMTAVEQIIQYGSVPKPGIGVYYRMLTDQEAYMLGLDQGILISGFMGGSTAESAGLKENDIIVKVNGTQITQLSDLSDVIAAAAVGDKITLTVYRSGQQADVEVTIGNMNEMTSTQTTTK